MALQLPLRAKGWTVSEALLEVSGLEVVYGHAIRAIQGVAFQAREGEITGLVGLNGAGKTTTIRAISGFLPTEKVHITNGSIRFAGVSIVGARPYYTSRLGIAVVPERAKVFDTLSVLDNLLLAASTRGSRKDEGRKSVRFACPEDVLVIFPELRDCLSTQAIFLSGGQRQMLALGACLLTAPRLLIVDEASLGLAPLVRRRVFELLRQLNTELGLAVLIVDQDVASVLSIAHAGYVLENGRVVFSGSAQALLQHGDVQEFYLGNAGGGEIGYKNVKQYRRVRRWY